MAQMDDFRARIPYETGIKRLKAGFEDDDLFVAVISVNINDLQVGGESM